MHIYVYQYFPYHSWTLEPSLSQLIGLYTTSTVPVLYYCAVLNSKMQYR